MWQYFYQVDRPPQIAYGALREEILGAGRSFSRRDEDPVQKCLSIDRPVGSNNEGLVA